MYLDGPRRALPHFGLYPHRWHRSLTSCDRNEATPTRPLQFTKALSRPPAVAGNLLCTRLQRRSWGNDSVELHASIGMPALGITHPSHRSGGAHRGAFSAWFVVAAMSLVATACANTTPETERLSWQFETTSFEPTSPSVAPHGKDLSIGERSATETGLTDEFSSNDHWTTKVVYEPTDQRQPRPASRNDTQLVVGHAEYLTSR